MHPLWKDKRGLALYLTSWAVLGILLSVAAAARGELGWGEAHASIVVPAVLFGFLCLSTWYLCRSFPLDRDPVVRILSVFFTASVLSSGLWVLVVIGWGALLETFGVWPGLAGRLRGGSLQWFVTGNILFLLAVAIHYLLIASQNAGENERKMLQLSLLARDAELRVLRARIDPHFLFNSLNSVSALTASDPAAARTMVLRLAGFLRSALHADRKAHVTVGDELELVRDYLEIERIRFGERLSLEVHAEPAALSCALPPLILQPLVENAVKHGIAHRLEGGTVAVTATRSAGRLCVRVANPAEPDRPRGNGLGLASVRERLAAQYGGEGSVSVVEEAGRFVVELSLPAREAPGP